MSAQMPPQHDPEELPLLYQRDDTALAFRLIDAGESQAFVDVGASGKSNFVRHLVRDLVKQQYIPDRKPYQVLMILLNPHQIIHLEENALQHSGRIWPGYELMLNRLKYHVNRLDDHRLLPQEEDMLNEVKTVVVKAYQSMFGGTPLMVQSSIRLIEDAVSAVLELGPRWQIVFILDELEEFLRSLPVEFFQSLRGLRDDHKRRVMYMTTSRHTPSQLLQKVTDQEQYMVLEGFIELFHDFTNYLHPLDDVSVQHNLRRYAYRYHITLSSQQEDYLRYATGSHIGLMRRGYIFAYNTEVHKIPRERFPEHLLLNSEKVQRDCTSLYDSLSGQEQTVMKHIARGQLNVPPDVRQMLFNKHLINKDGQIMIPVLREYLMRLSL